QGGHGRLDHAGGRHGDTCARTTEKEIASVASHGGSAVQWPVPPALPAAGGVPMDIAMEGMGLPIKAACNAASASQKSRCASIAWMTLAICSRESASSSNTPISMPL